MIPVLLIHPQTFKRETEAEKILIEQGISRQHPDLLWFEADAKMGVEQARQIKDFLSLKPYQGNKHAIVIVSAENLTLDAQNTLLKTLEEPPGATVMILGLSSEEQLLPTILSRCQVIDLNNSNQLQNIANKYQKDIKKLLSSNMEARFQFIEKLQERGEFLLSLTSFFRHKFLEKSVGGIVVPPQGCPYEIHEFLKDLLEAEKWTKSNVNIRAILEYLILRMPQKKI